MKLPRPSSQTAGNSENALNVLFLHVPKLENYYRLIGRFSFILYPPIGLLGLADYLRQNRIRSRIVHLGVDQHLHGERPIATLLDEHPAPIIGLDLHWHFQSHDVIETARRIKLADPKKRIVLGGFTASLFAREILAEFPFIDFVVRGDAEQPLADLVRQCGGGENFASVPNLSYRDGGAVRVNPITFVADEHLLNQINYTDFTLLRDYREYIEHFSRYVRLPGSLEHLQSLLFSKYTSYPVFIGRGCSFDCSYCGGSHRAQEMIASRGRTVLRSPGAVLDSIRDLAHYGFDFACLASDCIPPAQADAFYLPIFQAIQKEQLPIAVEVERNFLPTEDFLETFSRLPLKSSFITLSPHTHNDTLRRANHLHRYEITEMEACLERMAKLQIQVRVCFTSGLPFETDKDMQEMAAYQKHLRRRFPLADIRTAMIEIEPGSPMSRNPEHYGLRVDRSTFLDYYRYHSNPHQDHWMALGFDRDGCPSQADTSRFFCKNFCRRFGTGALSPILCTAFGTLRMAGAFPILNSVLGLQKLGTPRKIQKSSSSAR